MAELKTSQIKAQPNSNMGNTFSKRSVGEEQPTIKKRRKRAVSEYKKSLQEKQKMKRIYGLSEKQFKKYVKKALSKMQRVDNVSEELVKSLEKRLDNVVLRLGLAKSQGHARQLVSHSYFLVNGKPVNIPSFQIKKGDLITLKEVKKKKPIFKDLSEKIKKAQVPYWLEVDKEKFEGRVIGEPSLLEVNLPVEIPLIFEFYSR